jgi:hypothetical protein
MTTTDPSGWAVPRRAMPPHSTAMSFSTLSSASDVLSRRPLSPPDERPPRIGGGRVAEGTLGTRALEGAPLGTKRFCGGVAGVGFFMSVWICPPNDLSADAIWLSPPEARSAFFSASAVCCAEVCFQLGPRLCAGSSTMPRALFLRSSSPALTFVGPGAFKPPSFTPSLARFCIASWRCDTPASFTA